MAPLENAKSGGLEVQRRVFERVIFDDWVVLPCQNFRANGFCCAAKASVTICVEYSD